jgi:Family of unknown function (DUF6188)
MECDLTWMIARSFAEVVFQDEISWFFHFVDGAGVRTESPWRLISEGRIVLSSEDHGQWYGLPEPIDAEVECHRRVVGSVIRFVEVRNETRDLVVTFESGDRLEIIPLSSGYESWEITAPGGRGIIAQGGGNLAG